MKQALCDPLRVLSFIFLLGLVAHCDTARATQIVTGSGGDSAPHVKGFDIDPLSTTASFLAYGAAVEAGVRVAAGDVNGDGTADFVTGLGPGFTPHVRALSGVDESELKSFFSHAAAVDTGIYVAAGDINDDGLADIVSGAATPAGGQVRAFNSADNSVLHDFFAHALSGIEVRVAAGDVNGDGVADIITAPGPGAPPLVKAFDGTNLDPLESFLAYPEEFRGGVFVAAGDVNGDGVADIITGAGSTSTHVKAFDGDGGAVLHSFFAYPAVESEVRVAAGDVNGDGIDDIITGLGPNFAPHVKAFSGTDLAPLASYFAYDAGYEGGIYVAGIPAVVPEPSALSLAATVLLASAMVFRRGRR